MTRSTQASNLVLAVLIPLVGALGCSSSAPDAWSSSARQLQANRMHAPQAVGAPRKDVGVIIGTTSETIHFYQQYVSSLWGSRCRYTPSCSRFGALCVDADGWLLALDKIAGRIISCNDQASAYRPAWVVGTRVVRTDWPLPYAATWAASSDDEKLRWLECVGVRMR